jgi:excinuclease ABC subunit B
MPFNLKAPFKPTGDQPNAIKQLVQGIEDGVQAQTLHGVTGSGKTFTMANVIQQTQKPTLIMSHNKTLVAQLYGEFKHFFPDNSVQYFVSYYDYYQPEAFIPSSNTYIEKDLNINEEIEKMRLKTTSALQSGRRDVIVVASVSCIYGAGNPNDYEDSIIRLARGQKIARNNLLHALVDSLYSRTTGDFQRSTFRVKGDTVDVFLAYNDIAIRISFFDNEIEDIESIDPMTGKRLEVLEDVAIFPAQLFITPKDRLNNAIKHIQDDMINQVEYFRSIGKPLEAKRLQERTEFDMEMMRELGYCSGIENYSRYMDGRSPGQRPFCLIDYFPEDFLLIIDESHVTLPQLRAMYGGDRSRKINLVDYGFRLPAALDNRPLKFEEFGQVTNQVVYVSATPADYEINESEGVIVEQVIRPTGLLDPIIEVKPCSNQVDDLLEQIDERIKMGDRILVTTLTKRMAEELDKYIRNLGISATYIHSEVKTLDRVVILDRLRAGDIDVLIGVNLLREGLDLPEVSLVAILDADKEGFLRSERSLVQTVGRAARNVNGKVIMYADKITESMKVTIEETERRRALQIKDNEENGIQPETIIRSKEAVFDRTNREEKSSLEMITNPYQKAQSSLGMVADPSVEYSDKNSLIKGIEETKKMMLKAAKEMDFMEAARLRDNMSELENKLKEI